MSDALANRYSWKKWEDVQEELAANYHILALEKDDDCVDVARAFEDFGTECGMACLAAYLHMDAWGAPRTAKRAVNMYVDIFKEMGQSGSQEFQDMTYWMPWVSTGPVDLAWPLAPTEWPKDLDRRGGLANVMLKLSAVRLDSGNCQVLAGRAIMKFLVEGMKKSRASRV